MEEQSSLKMIGVKDEDELSSITLRRFDVSDIDDFMVWATDERVSRYCRWDTVRSRDVAMNYITNRIMVHPWTRAICLNDRAIGRISVKPHSGNERCRGDLSYVVASKYWGKGVATKAVSMVVASIFEEWPHLERLEALVEVENIGSQKVLEKAGFKREGVLRKYFILKGSTRDVVVYSFISTDAKVD
ncbi:Acyl-CoA N-acyltransferases (NAT) superfamily protein [Thalictrum thalictroides]|uniref:Acyl-CoA N-acyltransferases (NAT) superfamily protein n=1 Tax=Thalictrum thalictroides TaxID=46969 RepID=A0A7J6UX73_THATH|nr:Acyl-CoA N-acyltransferases (NAT) superfamily protein [Thalictrum thalictroides]